MSAPVSELAAVHARVEAMQSACSARDQEIALVRMVRRGKIHELFPQHFADDMPRSMVANTIDNAARDTAELISPLPALACASGNMNTSVDAARAGKKNKIGSYYWEKSRLQRLNLDFSDAVLSYGFGAYLVEPDFEHNCPRIRWESSFGSYYYKDRFNQLRWYAKVTQVDVLTLCAMYPDKRPFIKYDSRGHERANNTLVKLVTYMDDKETIVYLPECGFHVLARVANLVGRVCVVIAERPDQEGRPRGQYDDSVFPQLGKAIMAMYGINAADKAINAPIAIPDDVTEMSYGPDATIRTQNPQGVQRVRLDVPDDVFMVGEQMDRAIKEGSRYPETRTGGVSGNIITGRGVEALAGTLMTQVKTMQTVIGAALEDVTSLCMEMDVAFWGDMPKKITGVLSGEPFELTYTPRKDLSDSYGVKVTYGFASGQTPAQAIVALLQLRADSQISRAYSMRQLPFDIDVEKEQRTIDVEELADAAKQGLAGLAQAFGPMIMQGQDPLPVLTGIAAVINHRRKGMPMADALIKAFTPPEPPPEAPEQVPGPGEPGAPGAEELPPGVRDNGLLEGVPYGQAGAPPGGMPSVQGLLSSLRGNGQAMMEASTMRKKAISG